MATAGAGRTRNWTCVVYPESLPDDWRLLMDRCLIPWVESPLHDRDLYDDRFDYDNEAVEKDGKRYKKPHYHLMIMFDGVKDERQLIDTFDFLNIKHFQKINSCKGVYNYLWHNPLLYPDKASYLQSDVVFHMGARLEDVVQPSAGEINVIYSDILRWIDQNNIHEISTLQKFAFDRGIQDWIYVINRKSLMLYQYLRSRSRLNGARELVLFDEKGVYLDE